MPGAPRDGDRAGVDFSQCGSGKGKQTERNPQNMLKYMDYLPLLRKEVNPTAEETKLRPQGRVLALVPRWQRRATHHLPKFLTKANSVGKRLKTT